MGTTTLNTGVSSVLALHLDKAGMHDSDIQERKASVHRHRPDGLKVKIKVFQLILIFVS
jgi:hypothetical protein